MANRAKLTLVPVTGKAQAKNGSDEMINPTVDQKKRLAVPPLQPRSANKFLGRGLLGSALFVGLTVASLVIFKRKLF